MKYIDLCEIYEKLESTSRRLEKTYYLSQLIKKTKAEELSEVMLLLEGRVFPLWDTRKLGMASRSVVKAINTATGIDTDKIENEWKKTGDLGLVAEIHTKQKKQATLFSQELTIKKVFNNLQKLSSMEGQGTVDMKTKLVAELLTSATPSEAKYIIRTVLEDMRVGVGSGSLRDAIVWSEFPLIIGLELSGEGDQFYFKDYQDKEKDKEKFNKEKIKADKIITSKSEFDKINILKIKAISTEKEKKEQIEGKELSHDKELARELFNYFVEKVEEAYNIANDWADVIIAVRNKGLKGLSEINIKPGKPVKVMLYQKAGNIAEAFERVGKPCAFEYKYDGFRCITGHTPIYVYKKGLLSVKDVKKGDLVLTHKGHFKEVIAVNKRNIDKHERLFKIQSYLGNGFRISEGHKILINRNNRFVWVNSEKLSKEDYVAFPIPTFSITSKPLGKTLILKDSSNYSKKISINLEFFRLLGYWIGDGFTNDYHNTERVGIVFNKDHKEMIEKYVKIIRDVLKIDKISNSRQRGMISVYWRDKPLRIWLSTYFRREWKGKTLPDWFFNISKLQFLAFLKGWIESDGYTDSVGRTSITTKERDLAMFAQLIALKHKIVLALKKFNVNDKTYYKLVVTKSKRGYKITNNYILVKLLKIEEIKRPDSRINLYNLQVKDDESYCTTLFSLHNCEIHVIGKRIMIFTRSFENVTEQFPDVVEYVKKYVNDDVKEAILDSEAVGFNPKTTQYLPFQSISQRIKRIYNIKELSKLFPVEVNVFDILYYNGKSMISEEFHKRRALLSKIIDPHPRKIVLSRIIITNKEEEANKFYQNSLDAGNEGVMAKNLEAIYKPGSRVGYGVKVKPVMESLDLVITGAEWGEGKRKGWLTSFVVACRDEEGNIVEIGKVGTGIKELEEEGVTFNKLTELLKPDVREEKGQEVKVKPKIVIEVHYEEIQKSPTYSSGYALRFPRFVRLREDRNVNDISTLKQVEELYKCQRGRN